MSNSMQIFRDDLENSTSPVFITPAAVWHRDQIYTIHDYFYWSGEIEAGGERTLHLLFNRLDNFSASNNWNSVSIGIQDQVNGERSYTFWGGPCFGDHHPGFYARLNETLVCRWLDSEGRWYPEHVGT